MKEKFLLPSILVFASLTWFASCQEALLYPTECSNDAYLYTEHQLNPLYSTALSEPIHVLVADECTDLCCRDDRCNALSIMVSFDEQASCILLRCEDVEMCRTNLVYNADGAVILYGSDSETGKTDDWRAKFLEMIAGYEGGQWARRTTNQNRAIGHVTNNMQTSSTPSPPLTAAENLPKDYDNYGNEEENEAENKNEATDPPVVFIAEPVFDWNRGEYLSDEWDQSQEQMATTIDPMLLPVFTPKPENDEKEDISTDEENYSDYEDFDDQGGPNANNEEHIVEEPEPLVLANRPKAQQVTEEPVNDDYYYYDTTEAGNGNEEAEEHTIETTTETTTKANDIQPVLLAEINRYSPVPRYRFLMNKDYRTEETGKGAKDAFNPITVILVSFFLIVLVSLFVFFGYHYLRPTRNVMYSTF